MRLHASKSIEWWKLANMGNLWIQNYPLNQLTSCFRFHFLLNNSVLSSSGFNNLYSYSIIKLIYLIIWILIILFLANEFFSRLIRTREIWRSSKNLNELDIGPFQNFLQMIVNFTMIVSGLRFMSDKKWFRRFGIILRGV